MYYPSATSHDMKSFNGSSGVKVLSSVPWHLRDFKIQQSYVFFVLVIISFISTFVLCVPALHASNREIAEEYRRQGYAAQLSDQYSNALTFYYKASALDPKNASYWNDLGLVYELMGQETSAENAYKIALSVNPSYLAPYANLGHLYHRKQNTIKAIEYFQKRVELGDPADPWTQKAREDLEAIFSEAPLYRERFLKAETKRLNLQASQQTRENFKNQMLIASSEYERGMALLEVNKPKEALKAFTLSLTFAPQNPKTIKARDRASKMFRAQQIAERVEKAMQLVNNGNEQGAKQQFKDILAIFPNQP